MPITLDTAREIAKQYIASDETLVLYETPIASADYGWVFAYESARYLKTKRFVDMLFGNAPILIEAAGAVS